MTPEDLKNITDKQIEQEKLSILFDEKKCKAHQKDLEEKYAKYILKKEVVPVTRWYFEDIKDSTIQIELKVGDAIQHIELEQSFSFDNVYKGSIQSTIVELSPKYVKVATPEKYYYLITEGAKVFSVFSPLYDKEFDVQERMMRLLEKQRSPLTFSQIKTLLIIALSIISISIFCGIVLF